ncbi:RagB/SusD family nutrient uptake outer membrane protein [Membranihabitans maritimus]|uniref:RagB/SusD family nutrient uptake outer membrane protein n=1 Tax=Membranihabitans maritimus TaxID=2904244 RepID=UPI001F2FA1A6|nr:RagB/SusD family nutrient uptake outer membrane protein [Membranihabitans maritimus]
MKNLFRLNIFIITILFVISCNEQLNQVPTVAPSSETFYSSEEELILAINGVYNQTLWFEVTPWNLPAPLRFETGTDLSFERMGLGMKSVTAGNSDSQTGIFSDTWNHLYRSISQANGLLQNMSRAEDVVSEDLFERIQAEARFLRAFSYHYLTELYGDVPLLVEVPTIEEAQIARTPKQDVVDQIYEDLDYAAQVLPTDWPEAEKGRITKGAALALKARVALYNENWSLAVQSTQAVMDLGKYELYQNYEDQFQYQGEHSSGVILDTDYEKSVHATSYARFFGSRNITGWSTVVPSQFAVDSYEAIDGKPIDESSVYDPGNPFQNRDPRLDASIVRAGGVWDDFIFQDHPDSVETWRVNSAGERVEKVSNQDATNPFSTFTGYLWRKYYSPIDRNDLASSSLNFIYIRYAEVLLTYAEAMIEMGEIDQSVLNAINLVRARAYGVELTQGSMYPEITTTNPTELREIIRRERKVEFAGEGLRLFDIKRWGIADEVVNGTLIGRPLGDYSSIPKAPEIDENGSPMYSGMENLFRNVEERVFTEKDWFWAIPQSELDLNDKITQNVGY